MPEHQQAQKSTESKSSIQKQATPVIQAPASNPMAIIQRARINPKSLTHADVMQLQRTIGNRAVGRLLSEIGLIPSTAKQAPPAQRQEIPEEEEPLQGKFERNSEQGSCPSCSSPLQAKENHTGMPDNLKTGVENLSGLDMSDVKVHYNSDKPANVGALAYTQGTDIHVAPGQERHLPHEAWHVVQQAQGRVKPTMQLKDVAVNDDAGLELEADEMGEKASMEVIVEGTHDKFPQTPYSFLKNQEKIEHYQNIEDTSRQMESLKQLPLKNTSLVQRYPGEEYDYDSTRNGYASRNDPTKVLHVIAAAPSPLHETSETIIVQNANGEYVRLRVPTAQGEHYVETDLAQPVPQKPVEEKKGEKRGYESDVEETSDAEEMAVTEERVTDRYPKRARRQVETQEEKTEKLKAVRKERQIRGYAKTGEVPGTITDKLGMLAIIIHNNLSGKILSYFIKNGKPPRKTKLDTQGTTAIGFHNGQYIIARQERVPNFSGQFKQILNLLKLSQGKYVIVKPTELLKEFHTGLHAESYIIQYLFRTFLLNEGKEIRQLNLEEKEDLELFKRFELLVADLQIGASQGACWDCAGFLNSISVAHGEVRDTPSGMWVDPITGQVFDDTTNPPRKDVTVLPKGRNNFNPYGKIL